jgi:transporter family-2 protein
LSQFDHSRIGRHHQNLAPVEREQTAVSIAEAGRWFAMNFLFILIALVAGTFNAIEAGTNTALRKGLGTPFWAVAFISLVTLAISILAALVAGERIPSWAAAAAIPWWGWLGGLLGFGFVAAMVFTADSLGAALFIALTVAASTIGSVLLDHFGLLGFSQHSAGIGRVLGALMLIGGVALIARF